MEIITILLTVMPEALYRPKHLAVHNVNIYKSVPSLSCSVATVITLLKNWLIQTTRAHREQLHWLLNCHGIIFLWGLAKVWVCGAVVKRAWGWILVILMVFSFVHLMIPLLERNVYVEKHRGNCLLKGLMGTMLPLAFSSCILKILMQKP